MHLPRLYPIVDVASLVRRGVDLAQFTRELVEGGAEILQLRDKDGSPQEVLQRAAMIAEAPVAPMIAAPSGTCQNRRARS